MDQSASKLAAGRQQGEHQVDEQRAAILDAAEALFLRNGIEGTRMNAIAAQAGITRMSLYRYFPNRDEIALEIQKRMLGRIAALIATEDMVGDPLETMKKLARSMVRNFATLRDAYRYIGMFDSLYLDNPPGTEITEWTKHQLVTFLWNGVSMEALTREVPQGNRLNMAISTVIWFLEKLALRGELTWSDRSIPLEEHLRAFEDMIIGYIERELGPKETGNEKGPFVPGESAHR